MGGKVFPYIGEVLHLLDVTQAGERELLQLPALCWCHVHIIHLWMVCELVRLHDDDGGPIGDTAAAVGIIVCSKRLHLTVTWSAKYIGGRAAVDGKEGRIPLRSRC